MRDEIRLVIATPSRVFLEKDVSSVIIPAVRADINILPRRAPSVFVLDFGVLQILDKDGKPVERYFIQSGMAEIADDECKVMTQGVIPYADITAEEAKERIKTTQDEQGRLFFQMILDSQLGIQRRYLRTLKLISKKTGHPMTQEEVMASIKAELEELKRKNI